MTHWLLPVDCMVKVYEQVDDPYAAIALGVSCKLLLVHFGRIIRKRDVWLRIYNKLRPDNIKSNHTSLTGYGPFTLCRLSCLYNHLIARLNNSNERPAKRQRLEALSITSAPCVEYSVYNACRTQNRTLIRLTSLIRYGEPGCAIDRLRYQLSNLFSVLIQQQNYISLQIMFDLGYRLRDDDSDEARVITKTFKEILVDPDPIKTDIFRILLRNTKSKSLNYTKLMDNGLSFGLCLDIIDTKEVDVSSVWFREFRDRLSTYKFTQSEVTEELKSDTRIVKTRTELHSLTYESMLYPALFDLMLSCCRYKVYYSNPFNLKIYSDEAYGRIMNTDSCMYEMYMAIQCSILIFRKYFGRSSVTSSILTLDEQGAKYIQEYFLDNFPSQEKTGHNGYAVQRDVLGFFLVEV